MKIWLSGALIALGTSAFAHSGVKDEDVRARMQGMSAIADGVKVIGTMARGKTDFDAGAVDEALATIAREAARVPELFETPADDPKSEARAAIWDDFDDFSSKADRLETLAQARVGTVARPADLRPLMRAIGGACKSCHGEYRE